MNHHRGSGRAPPPPQIRGSRSGGGSRPSGRSRSRSRSPPRGSGGSGGRYGGSAGGGRNERDSRELRDSRTERDRDRRRSGSPYGGGGSSRDRDRKSSSTAATASKTSDSIPAISIVHSEAHASIVRRILNPEEVKIPRRVNEGSKPIFERDDLREAMLRRMRNDDNEENPRQSNAYIQEPAVTQQRVVAIIREPVGGSPLDAYLATKDPAFHHAVLASTGAVPPQRSSPDRRAAYNRRSASPSPRTVRQGGSGGTRPRSPPQQLSSRSSDRDREQRERERLIVEREREIERQREQLLREREQQHSTRERLPPPEREREFRERDRDLLQHRPDERERENRSRFNAAPPVIQAPHPRVDARQRIRSRSPVTRVLREEPSRLRRRSRSHSVTPPPMPDAFRQRMILERQKQIDLRSSLSRQPGKFGDDRAKGRPGPSRGGGRGGRGGFPPRSVRGREDERRAWLHDMYDGEDEPKKG